LFIHQGCNTFYGIKKTWTISGAILKEHLFEGEEEYDWLKGGWTMETQSEAVMTEFTSCVGENESESPGGPRRSENHRMRDVWAGAPVHLTSGQLCPLWAPDEIYRHLHSVADILSALSPPGLQGEASNPRDGPGDTRPIVGEHSSRWDTGGALWASYLWPVHRMSGWNDGTGGFSLWCRRGKLCLQISGSDVSGGWGADSAWHCVVQAIHADPYTDESYLLHFFSSPHMNHDSQKYHCWGCCFREGSDEDASRSEQRPRWGSQWESDEMSHHVTLSTTLSYQQITRGSNPRSGRHSDQQEQGEARWMTSWHAAGTDTLSTDSWSNNTGLSGPHVVKERREIRGKQCSPWFLIQRSVQSTSVIQCGVATQIFIQKDH